MNIDNIDLGIILGKNAMINKNISFNNNKIFKIFDIVYYFGDRRWAQTYKILFFNNNNEQWNFRINEQYFKTFDALYDMDDNVYDIMIELNDQIQTLWE